ncbi:MAG: protein kinase, partial [Planctomycetes bacterium]|nr:protein kinase [Planctomycetota bacterium]
MTARGAELVGQKLGSCRLLHVVAKGGMGRVYRGRHEGLNIDVAVKVLFPELAVDSEYVKRFRREARLAARLDHPNIVRVIDVGEERGFHYIVMEFINGESLAHRLKR